MTTSIYWNFTVHVMYCTTHVCRSVKSYQRSIFFDVEIVIGNICMLRYVWKADFEFIIIYAEKI